MINYFEHSIFHSIVSTILSRIDMSSFGIFNHNSTSLGDSLMLPSMKSPSFSVITYILLKSLPHRRDDMILLFLLMLSIRLEDRRDNKKYFSVRRDCLFFDCSFRRFQKHTKNACQEMQTLRFDYHTYGSLYAFTSVNFFQISILF